MKKRTLGPLTLHDFAPTRDSFRDQVLRGLHAPKKSIPCKFFYDEQGSRLFDAICELEEYYPTRTELAILEASASDMARALGARPLFIELGSGSGNKTRRVLDELDDPAAYVPIDIAREHLLVSAILLLDAYAERGLEVLPVCADYTQDFELPKASRPTQNLVFYFPGSTIGNLAPDKATALLRHLRALARGPCALLLGVDLEKERATLEAAYDDGQGVTAAFNLNLLSRINRELGGTFELEHFRHRAFYDEARHRIEMQLWSTRRQAVRVAGQTIDFAEGEPIVTEHSHKFDDARVRAMAEGAGYHVERAWTDPEKLFSVQLLRSP